MTSSTFVARLVTLESLASFLFLLLAPETAKAFVIAPPYSNKQIGTVRTGTVTLERSSTLIHQSSNDNEWTGEVVANAGEGGRIQGCSIQLAEGSKTEWIIKIDGIQADLGRFSDVIYRKITADAKQERFQGFRPGTIPPHLQPTYRAFAMDECARETVLEAMQQNNIRPFENARSEMQLEQFEIPPPPVRRRRKKKKSKKKGAAAKDSKGEDAAESSAEGGEPSPPAWITYDTMKEAIDAGWKPGQSFSFVAVNVKGQQVKDASVTEGARPLGGLSWNK